ncbi:tetratricopeptide (TPR) repeat protein [Elusimicrobium simillimum]|uniref:tetratricopeptide repeat protein n=1 Tax=Elusimicrobium simillimum TaxID=3143438 RepID=UPI003C6F0374
MKNKISLLMAFIFIFQAVSVQAAIWPFAKKEKKKLTEARAEYAVQNYHGAISKLKEFLVEGTVKRREVRAYILLGDCYEKIGALDSALNTYLEAVEMHPKNKQLLLKLGALYQRTDLIQNSTQIYQRVLEIAPENEEALLGLARAYMSEGFFSKAEEFYQKYFRTNAKNKTKIYQEYAFCYYRQRNYNAALLYVALFMEKEGESFDGLFLAAAISRQMGHKAEAYEFIDKAIALQGKPQGTVVKALWNVQDGEYSLALSLAQEAFKEDSDNQLALYIQYLCYKGLGKPREAKKQLEAIAAFEQENFISRVAALKLNQL